LRVAPSVSAVTLPMAVSLFRYTSPVVNLSVVLFVAHVSGVQIGIAQLIAGVTVAVVTNFAIVGLPSQITFFTTTVPISFAMGVPTGILPLLLAIEVIPDLFRTVGNVTADLAVTVVVGRAVGESGTEDV
jgi:Na+/H+-dicarboxylate symporter